MLFATVRASIGVVALLMADGAARPPNAPSEFLTVPLAKVQAVPSDPPGASVSADGRHVAFTSFARLAVSDTNQDADIYVLDRVTGHVTLETPPPARHASIPTTSRLHLSGDGRLLIYEASDDAPFPPRQFVVLRDRRTGGTHRFERRGEAANGGSRGGAISADGRIAVFASAATNLTDGPDANGSADDVYSVDIASMTIRRVSVDREDRQPAVGASFAPAVSSDGRYIAFSSTAPLAGGTVPTAAGGRPQVNVYLRDMTLGRTTRISVSAGSAVPNGSSYDAAISGDGRYVAFVSEANNLVPRDDNRAADVFLRETRTGTTQLVSRGESGGVANGPSGHPAISSDGGIVSFQSDASNLSCGRRCTAIRDINLVADVFVFDRASRIVRRVSVGRTAWKEPSTGPAVDASGTVIAFSSRHPIDADDDRDDYDLFISVPGREGPGP